MAFKLTKAELTQRDELNDQLQKAWGAIEAAQAIYNDKLDELKAPLEEAVNKFNDLLGTVKEFTDGISERADGEFNDKSERWQEGDKGSEARDWISEYENFEIDGIEAEFPDALDIGQPEIDLTALPDEAG